MIKSAKSTKQKNTCSSLIILRALIQCRCLPKAELNTKTNPLCGRLGSFWCSTRLLMSVKKCPIWRRKPYRRTKPCCGSPTYGDNHLVTVHVVTDFWWHEHMVTASSGDAYRWWRELLVTYRYSDKDRWLQNFWWQKQNYGSEELTRSRVTITKWLSLSFIPVVINHKIELKRVFKNQTVLSKMSPLCWSERAKAKSSKFFFLQEAVLGRRLLQVGGCKCRRKCDARGNRPQILTGIKGNLLHQTTFD